MNKEMGGECVWWRGEGRRKEPAKQAEIMDKGMEVWKRMAWLIILKDGAEDTWGRQAGKQDNGCGGKYSEGACAP